MRLSDIAENILKKLVSLGMSRAIWGATNSRCVSVYRRLWRSKAATISRRANPVKRPTWHRQGDSTGREHHHVMGFGMAVGQRQLVCCSTSNSHPRTPGNSNLNDEEQGKHSARSNRYAL